VEPSVAGRAFVVLGLAFVVAALALLSGRHGYANDRRLGALAGFSLAMTLLSVTLLMIVGQETVGPSRSPALPGGALRVVIGSFFCHVMLAGSIIGRS